MWILTITGFVRVARSRLGKPETPVGLATRGYLLEPPPANSNYTLAYREAVLLAWALACAATRFRTARRRTCQRSLVFKQFAKRGDFVTRVPLPTSDVRQVLLEAYAVNERINQLILENLDPRAWRVEPPGRSVRTIAAIFAHVHNIRRKWLRLSAPHLKLPAQLDRARCTPRQARAALAKSATRCSEMLAEALTGSNGRVQKFRRDGWAKPWPAGAAMVTYMLAHETHHRGQVCMLAHQLGFPLPSKVTSEMWSWERLWRQCGFTHPR